MKPICIPCARFFRPKKNDFTFIEAMPRVPGAEPGTAHAEQWSPYKLWAGDKWKCEGCGAEIIVGVAMRPLGEHYEPDFEKQLEHYRPEVQVNDC